MIGYLLQAFTLCLGHKLVNKHDGKTRKHKIHKEDKGKREHAHRIQKRDRDKHIGGPVDRLGQAQRLALQADREQLGQQDPRDRAEAEAESGNVQDQGDKGEVAQAEGQIIGRTGGARGGFIVTCVILISNNNVLNVTKEILMSVMILTYVDQRWIVSMLKIRGRMHCCHHRCDISTA